MTVSPDQPISPADHSRSGDDVAEAVEVAERGSAVEDVHDQPERTKPGEAPVERSAGDPEMTEGQVVLGAGGEASPPPGGVEPESSGAAQAQRGTRVSDAEAAREDRA